MFLRSLTHHPAPSSGLSAGSAPPCSPLPGSGCSFPECAGGAGATWRSLGVCGTFSSISASTVCLLLLLLLLLDHKHLQTCVSWVSVLRCCSPPCWLWSVFAPDSRTRPAESRSGSSLTPKRGATRRVHTRGSASATTHASAPEATKERPASMVMLPHLNLIYRVLH